MTTPPRTGRPYLRVSKDRTGQARSVDEQQADHERHAQQRGVTLGPPYDENGAISASRYGKKSRGGFARLLADLRTGRYRDDELWLWESSRGSRKVGEWVELVEALEAARVCVYVTSHSRLYDPTVPRDRRSLLEDAVDSEYESGKTSARGKRAKASAAAAGRPNGDLGYGWTAVHDPETGARRYVIEPAEAGIIREMYARVAAGDSLASISRDLTARGVRTRSGGLWSIQRIRPALLRPAYKAVRKHQPSWPEPGPVTYTAAAWPPVVDVALWDRVTGILNARTPSSPRPGRAVHLLSLIAVCDVCDDGLIASASNGRTRRPHYRCRGAGHVRIGEAELDRIAERLIIDYLTRPDVAEQLIAAAASTPDLDAARTDLAGIGRELDGLYEQVSAGRLSAAALAGIEPGLLARKTAAEARVRELSAPPALAGILTPGPGARRRWKALEIGQRRQVARLLLSPELLGQLRVVRGGRWAPVEDRVEFARV